MLHHLALTASDLAKSTAFYDAILGVLGYKRTITADALRGWEGGGPEILLYPVEGEDSSPHRFGRPGWHHAAFAATGRDAVDGAAEAAADGGYTIVHPPKEYPYVEGYYAVFLEDPDGVRFEVAFIPDARGDV